MKYFFYGCLIAGSVFTTNLGQAQRVTVPQSGIAWEHSFLVVEAFRPSHASHKDLFSCFNTAAKDLPVQVDLRTLGFESSDKGPLSLEKMLDSGACFQQAGAYDLTLQVRDWAGNLTTETFTLTVKPATLDLENSELLPVASRTSGGQQLSGDVLQRTQCLSPSLVADGQDACVVELTLRDRFKNVVPTDQAQGIVTLSLPTEGAAPDLNARRNPYGAFLKGLYVGNEQKQYQWRLPQPGKKLEAELKAYVPTLQALSATDERLGIKAQPLNLKLDYQTTLKGAVVETKVTNFSVLFSPLVSVMARASGSLEGFVLLPLNQMVNVPLKISSLVAKALPSKLTLDWVSPELETLWVQFVDSNKPEKKTLKQLLKVAQSPQNFELALNLRTPEGASSQEAFSLQPVVTYPQKIAGETQLVRYPLALLTGVGLETLTPFKPLALAVSIEGRLATESTNVAVKSPHLVLSDDDKILFTRWREQLDRAVISLLRGQQPRQEKIFNISQDWGESDVAYFKGVTVHLTSDEPGKTPMVFTGGKKTLVVEDGNLYIGRDLQYNSAEDSLGIVVINSKPNDGLRGNVFVHQNVQHLVGSYFLDGVLASTQKLSDPSITDIIEDRELTNNQNQNAPLALQLILEGTIMARNTIGGADLNPAKGPNNQNFQRNLALIYDLNYVRRYQPFYDDSGHRLPDSQNDFCYKADGKTCDGNPSPLVIRYDGRVQQLPPPGFEAPE